jgi:HNH endonuclease
MSAIKVSYPIHSRSAVLLGVNSRFNKRDTLEADFRKNIESDPYHSVAGVWSGPLIRYRRNRTKNGVRRAIYQIACELFQGPIPDRHVVHHTCENPQCVNPDHLKALTRSEHMKAYKMGNGEKNVNAVLTNGAVHEIFDLVKRGVLQREIAKIYGATQSCISSLLHNRRWPHIYAEVFQGAPPKDFRFRSGFARRSPILPMA